VLAFVFTPTTSFTDSHLAKAVCDVLGEGGITTLLKEKPQEIKEGRNHILAFCSKWYSVAHLLCLVYCD